MSYPHIQPIYPLFFVDNLCLLKIFVLSPAKFRKKAQQKAQQSVYKLT